jgi:hypothetical protein
MNKFYLFVMLLLSVCGSTTAITLHRLRIHGGKIIDNDPEPTGDFKTIVIPIKRAGNLIVVEAQLDTLIGNFILDTGAPGLVLNATYFRGLPHLAEKEGIGINGQVSDCFTTTVRNFSLLDLHYDKLTAEVADLSAIENTKRIKILGLLGTRLFSKLAITIDLFNNVLYIHKLDDKGNILAGERPYTQPDMKTSFKLLNDVIFIKGAAEDNNMWFAFDTGAESNLLDQSNFKKLAKRMRVITKTTVTGVGTNKNYENTYAVFDKLVIGNYVFKNNHILFTRLEMLGKGYDNTVDAILGYDFFGRGIFTINFAKKEFEMYIYTYQDK